MLAALTSASTRSSTSSNSARLSGPALVFDVAGSHSLALVRGVAGSPSLALVLDVAGSPRLALVLGVAGSPRFALVFDVGCTSGRQLLRTVATLALAVTVLAPLSLAFAVAALASERARRRTRALRVGLACASALRLRVRTYREFSIRNETAPLCDFQLVDLTHELFDTRHAVTLPPGSVLNRSSWQRRLGGSSTSGLSISDGKAA